MAWPNNIQDGEHNFAVQNVTPQNSLLNDFIQLCSEDAMVHGESPCWNSGRAVGVHWPPMALGQRGHGPQPLSLTLTYAAIKQLQWQKLREKPHQPVHWAPGYVEKFTVQTTHIACDKDLDWRHRLLNVISCRWHLMPSLYSQSWSPMLPYS